MGNLYKNFYNNVDRENIYSAGGNLAIDPFYRQLKENFIKKFSLENKKILEIGSGNGRYQDIVNDYIGIDISPSLQKFYHKKYFLINPDENYQFFDNYFDGIFTRATFEHIPNINFTLKEVLRVLKREGYIFFHMAWYVGSWAAQGYSVRPYSELNFKEKLIKFFLPLRKNLLFRSLFIFPVRMVQLLNFMFNKKKFANNLKYKKLKPNYKKFWTSDSDACNYVDPFLLILWFMANNCKIINYPNILKAFFIRSGSLIIQKL